MAKGAAAQKYRKVRRARHNVVRRRERSLDRQYEQGPGQLFKDSPGYEFRPETLGGDPEKLAAFKALTERDPRAALDALRGATERVFGEEGGRAKVDAESAKFREKLSPEDRAAHDRMLEEMTGDPNNADVFKRLVAFYTERVGLVTPAPAPGEVP